MEALRRMTLTIRKILTVTEEVLVEGGKPAERPVTAVAVAAVVTNPWAGQGFTEDLRPDQVP